MPIFIPVESGQGLVTVLLLTYCIQMKYLFNGSLPTRLKMLRVFGYFSFSFRDFCLRAFYVVVR